MRTTLKTGISLLLILILTIGMSVPVLAQSNVVELGDNQDPDVEEMCIGYKIDEVNKIKYDTPYDLEEGDFLFTITKKLIDGVEYVDWSSNIPVSYIFVKGGNDGNLYTYNPAAMGGTDLHAPVNSSGKYAEVSHITFYVCGKEPAPSIDIEKLVSVDDGDTWHDADSTTGPVAPYPGTVKFKVIVTNTGNVALTDIDVDDTDFEFEGIASSLAPGASVESNIKEVVSVVGQHSNTADVEGFYGDMKVTDSDMAHYIAYEGPRPSIDIEKYVWNGETFEDADSATGPYLMSDPVFKFVVKNTGNVTLDDIEFWDVPVISNFFDDPALTDPFVLPGSLAPNAGFTCYGTMDWEDGQQSDTAYVTGSPPEGQDVSDSDSAYYFGDELTPRATIDIEKWVSVDGGDTWHDADSPTGPTIRLPGTVRFKVIVTNTGNVDLTNIVVTDPDFEFTGIMTSLEAGDDDESNVIAVSAERGQHSNTATVNAKYDGEPITPDSDKAHYYGEYERRDNDEPDISIKKYVSVDGGDTWDDAESAPGPRASFPGTVQFKVVVKNTGDYRLTDIEVTDTDFEFTGVASSLDEGDSDTSDIITIATIDGQHSNTAEVEGFYGSRKVSDSDKAHYFTRDDNDDNGKIRIHKFMDENRNKAQDAGEFHMQNVTFELYNANKTEKLSKQTDNEGNLTFTNLEFGTYYLKEASEYFITTDGFAADGFMQITVNSDETITIIVGNDIDRALASDNLEIVEEPVPLALPKTGEMPPTSFYILGALLMLAGMCLKRFE